jgi:hypothetical protein
MPAWRLRRFPQQAGHREAGAWIEAQKLRGDMATVPQWPLGDLSRPRKSEIVRNVASGP